MLSIASRTLRTASRTVRAAIAYVGFAGKKRVAGYGFADAGSVMTGGAATSARGRPPHPIAVTKAAAIIAIRFTARFCTQPVRSAADTKVNHVPPCYPLASSVMSTIGGPGGIGGPKGPGGVDGADGPDDIEGPEGADAAADVQSTAATGATGDIDALAAEVAAGRITRQEAIDRLVEATAGPELGAAERAELRELLTDLVANDPYLGALANRV
jgi:hypothetical protein